MSIHHALFAASIIAALASPSVAAAPAETAFAKLGRWSVAAVSLGGKFAYCSAEVDNGEARLRLATDGEHWRVGAPYSGNKKKIVGVYGFGDAAEQADFSIEAGHWAFLAITANQLDAFRRVPAFTINLDRGLQKWTLSGAEAAIEKAIECARGKGAKQGADASAPQPRSTVPGFGSAV